MTVASALAGVSSLALDTSPLIYFIERHPAHVDVMREILGAVNASRLRGPTSVITLTEILTRPKHMGDAVLEAQYRDLLLNSRNFEVRTIDVPTAIHAADIRAKYRLRTPDALQVSAAIVSGCQAFLTNDLTLRRVSEIRVLALNDLSL